MYSAHINKMVDKLQKYKGRESEVKGTISDKFLDDLVEALGSLERLVALLSEQKRMAEFHLNLTKY